MCRFLNLPSQAEELEILDALHTATETIRAAKDVRVASATTVVGGVGGSDDGPEYQTIHRIRCHSQHLGRDQGTKLYRDEPVPIHSDGRSVHLHGGRLIGNLELHLERHKSVAFLVYKDYDCCIIEDPALLYGSPAADADLGDASTMLANESVSIVSEALSDAMTKLGNEAKNSMPLPNFGRFEEFSSPYLWWYCQRDRLLAVAATFEPELLQHVMLFHEYILATLGDTYTEVDRLLKDGKIMPEYLPYLYVSCASSQPGLLLTPPIRSQARFSFRSSTETRLSSIELSRPHPGIKILGAHHLRRQIVEMRSFSANTGPMMVHSSNTQKNGRLLATIPRERNSIFGLSTCILSNSQKRPRLMRCAGGEACSGNVAGQNTSAVRATAAYTFRIRYAS